MVDKLADFCNFINVGNWGRRMLAWNKTISLLNGGIYINSLWIDLRKSSVIVFSLYISWWHMNPIELWHFWLKRPFFMLFGEHSQMKSTVLTDLSFLDCSIVCLINGYITPQKITWIAFENIQTLFKKNQMILILVNSSKRGIDLAVSFLIIKLSWILKTCLSKLFIILTLSSIFTRWW